MSQVREGELLELQRKMAAAIMHPLTGNGTMTRRRRDGALNRSEADAIIKPNDRLTSFERLEIYNRMYWFRLYSCFEEDFPGLKAILGSAKFEKLMREYLTECPSESFTLRNLGLRLVAWLEEHPEYVEPRQQLAMDMARLEWAHIEVFDSGAEELLDPDDLMGITDESRLRLQPYLRVLELRYPVDDLLIELQRDGGSSDSSSNNASAARKTKHVRRVAMLEPEEIYLAMHRQENSVYYKRLGREEFRLLRALLHGDTISEAIDTALEGSALTEEERGVFLQLAFAGWVRLGWFTRQISTKQE
ncbi:MAG TPA: DNA-binding domain-containing protein [Acidobacteriaceae bacterium]|nr:DNA-binding domain-containing protein [Acidobacteriaceae bacterium]